MLQPHDRRLVEGGVNAAAGVGAVWKVKSSRYVANAKPKTRKLNTLTFILLTSVRSCHIFLGLRGNVLYAMYSGATSYLLYILHCSCNFIWCEKQIMSAYTYP